MKGIDIVVKGSVGHHVGLHGAGRQSGGARRCRRGARRFHLRGAALRARQREEPRRRLHREAAGRSTTRRSCAGCSTPPASTARSMSASSAATARRASSIISTSTTSGPTDDARRTAGSTRRRASRRPSTTHAIAEIRRAAATGIYDIRGAGAKRKLPHFDDLLFLGASISRYPLEGYRETLRHRRRRSARASPRSRSR